MNDSTMLVNLNEKQQQAVSASPIAHLAVIAGAGSGKTRVLVSRIAWLLKNTTISANQILAVTFTNKAALELRERVEHITNISTKNMWLGTFHNIAYRLLQRHSKQANLHEAFQILDQSDQLRLIRKVHRELNLDDNKWPPTQSQWYINSKKDLGLRAKHITANLHYDKILATIYDVYEKQCERSGLVDFAELLLRSYELFSEKEDILSQYQTRFSYIFVDEFQDTNDIQYAWLKLLAGKKSRLMVIGDDDQSIYSWRGAKIENIFRFNRDFSPEIIYLEQNYRSTKTILAAANSVISHNICRHNKKLSTDGPTGDLIPVYSAFNEIDEAQFILKQINLKRKQGILLRDMAVLYRSNAQSRILEEVLLGANIPYRIYGGLKFFERTEIKDTLAYLRLLINPLDDTAFERIVNTPSRGIGNTTLMAVKNYARSANLPLWQASEMILQEKKLNSRASYALAAFLQLTQKMQQETNTLPLFMQIDYVIQQSGLYAHYNKDRSEITQSRLENLQELLQTAQRFNSDSDSSSPLQIFLSHVALENNEGHATKQDEDYVQLMTLHSAKGVEFEAVFLSGLEEGLFPHKMSLQSGKIEEERRLCYVGITRAKRNLYLTYAKTRRINGIKISSHMSRFIGEIPVNLLKVY
jgi:DNA helicase II / ATP-dependent DNA helicase PcrA